MKGPWTRIEDAMLMEYVKTHGEGSWNKVHKSTKLVRSSKSCRLRWANHLRPNLKKCSFSPEEEHVIIYTHSKIGNKWARIASGANSPSDEDGVAKEDDLSGSLDSFSSEMLMLYWYGGEGQSLELGTQSATLPHPTPRNIVGDLGNCWNNLPPVLLLQYLQQDSPGTRIGLLTH